jgi:hypothetical protein
MAGAHGYFSGEQLNFENPKVWKVEPGLKSRQGRIRKLAAAKDLRELLSGSLPGLRKNTNDGNGLL